MSDKSRIGAAKYISIGLETFIPIVLGALIGYFFLDKPNTTPVWTISLSMLGFLLGMYSLFKTIIQVKKESDEEHSNKHNSSTYN